MRSFDHWCFGYLEAGEGQTGSIRHNSPWAPWFTKFIFFFQSQSIQSPIQSCPGSVQYQAATLTLTLAFFNQFLVSYQCQALIWSGSQRKAMKSYVQDMCTLLPSSCTNSDITFAVNCRLSFILLTNTCIHLPQMPQMVFLKVLAPKAIPSANELPTRDDLERALVQRLQGLRGKA